MNIFSKVMTVYALLITSALADPVLLYPMPCGAVRNCVLIPNSAGIALSIYASTSYGFMTLNADGVQYVGKNVLSLSIVDALLTDPVSGKSINLTVDFSNLRTLNRSGHNYYVNHYALVDGEVLGLTDAPSPFGAVADPPADGGCGGCHGR